jgi:hypothetical protein
MNNDKNSHQSTPSGTPAHPEQTVPDTNTNAQNTPQSIEEFFGPAIVSITRKQLLAEGAQVDVSEMAAEAGFTIPVFMTDTVFNAYVKVPEGVDMQDEDGRLWDILWMLRCRITASNAQTERLPFQLYVRNDNKRARLVTLHAVCGAVDIDNPAPSITIMMPDED